MLTVKVLIDQLLLLDPEMPVTFEREGFLARTRNASVAVATPHGFFGDAFCEHFDETIESIHEMHWHDDEVGLGAMEVAVIR